MLTSELLHSAQGEQAVVESGPTLTTSTDLFGAYCKPLNT